MVVFLAILKICLHKFSFIYFFNTKIFHFGSFFSNLLLLCQATSAGGRAAEGFKILSEAKDLKPRTILTPILFYWYLFFVQNSENFVHFSEKNVHSCPQFFHKQPVPAQAITPQVHMLRPYCSSRNSNNFL